MRGARCWEAGLSALMAASSADAGAFLAAAGLEDGFSDVGTKEDARVPIPGDFVIENDGYMVSGFEKRISSGRYAQTPPDAGSCSRPRSL